LGCEAKPTLERGQFHRRAVPFRLVFSSRDPFRFFYFIF
jgi:hypothetical protein